MSIDLRSDTATRPTLAMRAAMAEAEVGDDVFGEDPTVNRLEARAAEMLGFDAAIYASSGTQGNLLGMLAHCGRGDEYIVGQTAHTYLHEGGGAAVLGSIQPQPLDFQPDGTIDLDQVASAIKPHDFHYARTRLLCLENTQGGKVLPLDYLDAAAALTRDRGLGLHLDGARVFNAAVKLGVAVERITSRFDSVSFCLSKGLGAPVGSVLCGSEALVARARRWRKMLGGGMRQAGVIAAAGLVALEQHVSRLADDHLNATRLAEGLAEVAVLKLDLEQVQTNMVFVSMPADIQAGFIAYMHEHDVLLSSSKNPMRLVTHLDISPADIEQVIALTGSYFARNTA